MSAAEPGDVWTTRDAPRRPLAAVGFVLGLLVLGVLLYYPVREAREAARSTACRENLRQIGIALHAYHDEHGSFPPAYTVDAEGRPMHSWRVLILPYLGQPELYADYHFDEPWDGPRNRELSSRIPAVFACPSHSGQTPGRTHYLAVVGAQAAWPEQHAASIRHILDGTANTAQVVEWRDSDVLWLEPRDVSFDAARQGPLVAMHPPDDESGLLFMLFVDGSVKAISTHIDRETYLKLLTARSGMPFPGVDWPIDLPAGTYDFGVAVSSEQLQATDIVPYTGGPITEGRNYVYCATFQLAWDDFRGVVGGDPIQLAGDPQLAAAMNAESFPRAALSEDSYVARGGMMRDGILDEILNEMSREFPDAQPQLLATRPSEMAVVMYAWLHKFLPFREKFERLPQPLEFMATDVAKPVAAFGLSETHPNLTVREQVAVLDHVSNDDFIVRISAGNQQDEIILAKIPRGTTLAETISTVQERISQPADTHNRRALEHGEPISIPVLTLNVERIFEEILQRDILNPELLGLWVERSAQIIRFRLDETGAHLISEAEIIGENGHSEPPPPPEPRRFIFDRPFLIAVQERGAPAPYFAAWIANTELME